MPQIYKMQHLIRKRVAAFPKDHISLMVFLMLFMHLSYGQDSYTPISNPLEEDTPEITNLLKKDDPPEGLGIASMAEVMAGIRYDTTFVSNRIRKADQKLTMFGYARMFAYGRNMFQPYPSLKPFEKAYGFGDGYREPMLSLNVFGRPNGKTAFGTELFMFTPYLGGNVAEENAFTMNLGLNFYGNFRTQHGNFGIRAGGIHWYYLSEFTIGVFQILERFSIFDRTPWEGVMNDEKYDIYYESGLTSPGDARWNNQAFQGLIINGGNLPGGFSFDVFWGKTQPNANLMNNIEDPFGSIPATLDFGSVPTYAGFGGDGRVLPNFITGGKIGRNFGKSSLCYNLMHSQTALDSINRQYRQYQIHSLSYDLKLGEIGIKGELAAGFYESPAVERRWGEALMLQAKIPKKYTFIPIDI